MSSKSVSARLPEKLVEYIDQISENRTNFIAKAVIQKVYDSDMVRNQIDKEKSKRDRLINKKQEIEKEIEATRDEIRNLENLKTKIETLEKVKNEVPSREINKVRQIVRENKYDSDPRSMNPANVVEHNAERIADEYELNQSDVEEVLEVATEV